MTGAVRYDVHEVLRSEIHAPQQLSRTVFCLDLSKTDDRQRGYGIIELAAICITLCMIWARPVPTGQARLLGRWKPGSASTEAGIPGPGEKKRGDRRRRYRCRDRGFQPDRDGSRGVGIAKRRD